MHTLATGCSLFFDGASSSAGASGTCSAVTGAVMTPRLNLLTMFLESESTFLIEKEMGSEGCEYLQIRMSRVACH